MESVWKFASLTSPRLRPSYVYRFRIRLYGISPPIWREILVSIDYGFYAFHSAIQDAFGWTGEYAYRFQRFSRRPGVFFIKSPFDGTASSYERDYHIRPYLRREGDHATYFYDFNCRWKFKVVFESMTTTFRGLNYPACVNGQRGSPPEDKWRCSNVSKAFANCISSGQSVARVYSIGLLASLHYSDRFDSGEVVFYGPLQRFMSTYRQ